MCHASTAWTGHGRSDTSGSTYENRSKPFVRTVPASELFRLLRRCEAEAGSRITVWVPWNQPIRNEEFDRPELLRELRRILAVRPQPVPAGEENP